MILLWLALLTEAGKSNRGGYLMISDSRPYTAETLSLVTDIPLPAVRQGLSIFTDLEMIDCADRAIFVCNWSKYQSEDKLEVRRQNDRLRKQRQREKERQSLIGLSDPTDLSRDSWEDPSRDVTRENRTIIDRENTTDFISALIAETPFAKISEQEFAQLISLYTPERLYLAMDIAAETWRRSRKERISNPAGYVHTLCASLCIPEWYVPYASRVNQPRAETDYLSEFEKSEEEARRWGTYWDSLPEQIKEKYILIAKEKFGKSVNDNRKALVQTAKSLAWNERTQTSTI